MKHRMFKTFTLISVSSLTLISSIAKAEILISQQVLSKPDGFYIGVFGGGGHSSNTSVTQTGTAFYSAAAGGPLAVNATGDAGTGAAIGGGHIGYQWSGWSLSNCRDWLLAPAVEFEGYYVNSDPEGDLINPTNRLPEHSFVDSFPMHTGVFLANAVFTFENTFTDTLYPYLGVGIGAADIWIRGADSTQIAPAEPGVNHFNSNPNDSDWAFAAQAKAGFNFKLFDNLRLFAEYRMLYLNSTKYTFGSTQYPTHVPTTNWNVSLGNMVYNMGDIGLEYSI